MTCLRDWRRPSAADIPDRGEIGAEMEGRMRGTREGRYIGCVERGWQKERVEDDQ